MSFPEKARPIVNDMNERIKPFICDAMDACLAARLTQQEAVDAILSGLLYQGGFFVAAFENATGKNIPAKDLSRAANAAVKYGRELVKKERANA